MIREFHYRTTFEQRDGTYQWVITTPGAVAELTFSDPDAMTGLLLNMEEILTDASVRMTRGEATPVEPSDVTKGLLE